jgi:hypothetical protein
MLKTNNFFEKMSFKERITKPWPVPASAGIVDFTPVLLIIKNRHKAQPSNCLKAQNPNA